LTSAGRYRGPPSRYQLAAPAGQVDADTATGTIIGRCAPRSGGAADPWLDGAKISDTLGDSEDDVKEDSREAGAP